MRMIVMMIRKILTNMHELMIAMMMGDGDADHVEIVHMSDIDKMEIARTIILAK